jgi:hypothetical protein
MQKNMNAPDSMTAPEDSAPSASGCGCAPTCCPGGTRQPGTLAGTPGESRDRTAPQRVG